MSEQGPVLPYAGTSGWSGSQTSQRRAERDDADGTTLNRQQRTLRWLGRLGERGCTYVELGKAAGLHHGQASGVLSTLHAADLVVRLREEREQCQVYVLPEFVNDRPVVPRRRTQTWLLLEDMAGFLRTLPGEEAAALVRRYDGLRK